MAGRKWSRNRKQQGRESVRPDQVRRLVNAMREEDDAPLLPEEHPVNSEFERAKATLESAQRNSTQAEQRAAYEALKREYRSTTPLPNNSSGGPMADMETLRARGEHVVSQLDELAARLAAVQGQVGELMGQIAAVAEQATEVAGQARTSVDTALGGARQSVQGMRSYLDGLTER